MELLNLDCLFKIFSYLDYRDLKIVSIISDHLEQSVREYVIHNVIVYAAKNGVNCENNDFDQKPIEIMITLWALQAASCATQPKNEHTVFPSMWFPYLFTNDITWLYDQPDDDPVYLPIPNVAFMQDMEELL